MKDYARELIAFSIVALFAFALFRNPSDTLMIGALIAAFSTAIGYYLGASKTGAETAAKNADTVTRVARNDSPQLVEVMNDEANPVPTVTPDV